MKTRFKGIKSASEHKRGELVKDLLKLIAAGVLVSAASVAAPNTLQLLEYLDPKSREERQKVWSAIRYLEKHGDIEVLTEANGKEYVYLTRRGKIRLDNDAIWDLQI